MAQAKPTFEENLASLKAVVEKLERGEIALEESIALYEEGMKYAAAMNGQLKKAAGKVTQLEKKREQFEESPFAVEDSADE